MKLWWVALVLLGLLPAPAQAVVVELTWSPNQEADLAGYKLYHSAGGTCPSGPLPPLLVDGTPVVLPKEAVKYQHSAGAKDGTWCYELTAFDTSNNESGRSNRASKTVDGKAPAAPVLRLGTK